MDIRETLLKDRSSYGITAGDKVGYKIDDKNGDVTVFKYPILDKKRGTLI